ncbi:MAG: hypothetical protein JRG89_23340 [Deltaproteobacteria bacterium]|nr:hypothetical protein [Deltaproteobacteria bacterium]
MTTTAPSPAPSRSTPYILVIAAPLAFMSRRQTTPPRDRVAGSTKNAIPSALLINTSVPNLTTSITDTGTAMPLASNSAGK